MTELQALSLAAVVAIAAIAAYAWRRLFLGVRQYMAIADDAERAAKDEAAQNKEAAVAWEAESLRHTQREVFFQEHMNRLWGERDEAISRCKELESQRDEANNYAKSQRESADRLRDEKAAIVLQCHTVMSKCAKQERQLEEVAIIVAQQQSRDGQGGLSRAAESMQPLELSESEAAQIQQSLASGSARPRIRVDALSNDDTPAEPERGGDA